MQYEMKDSGVEWIGEMPKEWDKGRIKYNYYMKGRIGWQGLKADEFIDNGPYYLITGTDFENGRIAWERCYRINKARFQEAPEIHVKIGDLLITKDGTVGKVAYIDHIPEKASLNSHLLIIRPFVEHYSNKYLFWIIQSSVFEKYCGLSQNGSIMASLSQEKMSGFSFPLPPLPEQAAIAAYLDKKCAAIDAIVAEAKATIDEYKAWKASVIFEAVTKGLPPNAEMKDSGVEWIGAIPKHWNPSRIKNECINMDSLREPISTENRINTNRLYDYYGASGIIDKIDGYNVDDTVLLIGEDGANLVFRNLPLVYQASGKFWVNNHAHILKVKAKNDYSFMAYMLEAGDYTNFITGSAQPKLTQSNLMRFPILAPPLPEQQSIAAYLDSKCAAIDGIIAEKKLLIANMEDYKKSLIFETVTGKRRVC